MIYCYYYYFFFLNKIPIQILLLLLFGLCGNKELQTGTSQWWQGQLTGLPLLLWFSSMVHWPGCTGCHGERCSGCVSERHGFWQNISEKTRWQHQTDSSHKTTRNVRKHWSHSPQYQLQHQFTSGYHQQFCLTLRLTFDSLFTQWEKWSKAYREHPI